MKIFKLIRLFHDFPHILSNNPLSRPKITKTPPTILHILMQNLPVSLDYLVRIIFTGA
jgi:hypothetical protein